MRVTRTLAGVLLAALALGGCERASEALSQDPPLPIKMMVCNEGYTDCRLVARYESMSSCKFHERLSNMLCDSLSQPGVITCTEPSPPPAFVSVCSE